ncbi:hypothetical protein WJ90_16825, partial [Burkholderia ubonensis]
MVNIASTYELSLDFCPSRLGFALRKAGQIPIDASQDSEPLLSEIIIRHPHRRASFDMLLRFPRFFAFQRPQVMQPHPLSAEPQA